MDLKRYLMLIEMFLVDYLDDNKGEGYVLGISGGIDSALVAALVNHALPKEKLHCLLMPIDSNPTDLRDGLLLCRKFTLNYEILDLSETYHSFLADFEKAGVTLSEGSKSNLKVRLRMSALYALGQNLHSFVLGTDNMDERYTGYFTKYGDGAADLLPIAYLTKREVKLASELYEVPEEIINKVPTAGLFENQTDEKEMGVSYNDLDNFLLGKEVKEEVKERILYLHKISEHKRKDIPTPVEFKRDEN